VRGSRALTHGKVPGNLELKIRVSKMKLDNTDLKKCIQLTEEKLAELEKLFEEALES